jgi:5'-nucleotidase
VSLETDPKYHYHHSEDVDFDTATHFARLFAKRMLAGELPEDVDVLKVDIPCDASPETPWRLTRLSRQRYFKPLPSGRRYLSEKRRLGYRKKVDLATLGTDTDVHAIMIDRVVAVTPLSLDMTSRVDPEDLEKKLR